ncbi:MAG: hypothetical protein ABI577_02585 [bacterium]
MNDTSQNWQEDCRLLIGGAVAIPSHVSVWSYDACWGGEVTFPLNAALSRLEYAALALEFDGAYPIHMVSVTHRAADQTTVHFEGEGPPPFTIGGVASVEGDRATQV